MFTIKKFHSDRMGYVAVACKSYRVEWEPEGKRIILDPIISDQVMQEEPQQTIFVDSSVFIENIAGKTIDHLQPEIGRPLKTAA